MTSDMRERLHQLADEVPTSFASPDLAVAAWAAGRRRRLRRRAASTALGVVLVAALAGALLGLTNLGGSVQPADGDPSAAVSGFPERITHQWWTTRLPERPGPVAGLLNADGAWDVVAADGHLWRSAVPHEFGDQYPTLSPDGRFLGYLDGVNGPFVIRDLVTGATRRVRGVGCGCSSPSFASTTPLFMEGQAPSHWSPDSRRLVLSGGSLAARGAWAVLIGPAGEAHAVSPDLPGLWSPAGWAGSRQLVWTDHGHRAEGSKVVDVLTTNPSGKALSIVHVRLPARARKVFLDQWTWTVSPDGHRLLFNSGSEKPSGILATYSLADGSVLGTSSVGNPAESCPNGFAGASPISPVLSASYAPMTVATLPRPHTLSVTDPALGAQCVIWASDALAGSAHGGLFGTSTAFWTWWWREAATAVATVLVATLLTVRVLRLRRQRDPAS